VIYLKLLLGVLWGARDKNAHATSRTQKSLPRRRTIDQSS
jgi:hypothetical protein